MAVSTAWKTLPFLDLWNLFEVQFIDLHRAPLGIGRFGIGNPGTFSFFQVLKNPVCITDGHAKTGCQILCGYLVCSGQLLVGNQFLNGNRRKLALLCDADYILAGSIFNYNSFFGTKRSD